MLSSITPLGERGRRARWGVTVAWYVAASVLGGAVLGGLLGLLGGLVPGLPLSPRAGLVALGAGGVLGVALDLRVGGVRLPSLRRQVNEDWLHLYRNWVYGFGFGVQLGFGIVTIVTTAAVYVTLLAALLTASWAAGLVVGATFGLVRALPLLAMADVTSAARLHGAHQQLQAWAPRAHRTTVGVLGVIAALGAVAGAS